MLNSGEVLLKKRKYNSLCGFLDIGEVPASVLFVRSSMELSSRETDNNNLSSERLALSCR
jgi:hypothetical protein